MPYSSTQNRYVLAAGDSVEDIKAHVPKAQYTSMPSQVTVDVHPDDSNPSFTYVLYYTSTAPGTDFTYSHRSGEFAVTGSYVFNKSLTLQNNSPVQSPDWDNVPETHSNTISFPDGTVFSVGSFVLASPPVQASPDGNQQIPSNTPTALVLGGSSKWDVGRFGPGKIGGTVVWDVNSAGARELSVQLDYVPFTGDSYIKTYRVCSVPGMANCYAEQNFSYSVPFDAVDWDGNVYVSLMAWQNSGHAIKIMSASVVTL